MAALIDNKKSKCNVNTEENDYNCSYNLFDKVLTYTLNCLLFNCEEHSLLVSLILPMKFTELNCTCQHDMYSFAFLTSVLNQHCVHTINYPASHCHNARLWHIIDHFLFPLFIMQEASGVWFT